MVDPAVHDGTGTPLPYDAIANAVLMGSLLTPCNPGLTDYFMGAVRGLTAEIRRLKEYEAAIKSLSKRAIEFDKPPGCICGAGADVVDAAAHTENCNRSRWWANDQRRLVMAHLKSMSDG